MMSGGKAPQVPNPLVRIGEHGTRGEDDKKIFSPMKIFEGG